MIPVLFVIGVVFGWFIVMPPACDFLRQLQRRRRHLPAAGERLHPVRHVHRCSPWGSCSRCRRDDDAGPGRHPAPSFMRRAGATRSSCWPSSPRVLPGTDPVSLTRRVRAAAGAVLPSRTSWSRRSSASARMIRRPAPSRSAVILGPTGSSRWTARRSPTGASRSRRADRRRRAGGGGRRAVRRRGDPAGPGQRPHPPGVRPHGGLRRRQAVRAVDRGAHPPQGHSTTRPTRWCRPWPGRRPAWPAASRPWPTAATPARWRRPPSRPACARSSTSKGSASGRISRRGWRPRSTPCRSRAGHPRRLAARAVHGHALDDYAVLIAVARERGLPVATHLLESTRETQHLDEFARPARARHGGHPRRVRERRRHRAGWPSWTCR